MNRAYYDGFLDPHPVELPMKSPSSPAARPVIPALPRPYDPPYESQRPTPTKPHDTVNLQSSANAPRPRSLPPPYDAPHPHRCLRHSTSYSLSSSKEYLPGRARGVIKDNFTDSRSGLGVGILGAIVGGIVAHEVSHATVRGGNKSAGGHLRRSEPRSNGEKASRLATLAGAVVGGLGANAMERKFEDSRRGGLPRDDWVRRWDEDGGFWQCDWGSPLDHPRGRARRQGTEEYEVAYEGREPRRKGEGVYRH
ncbi:hypothetical protein VUR80DRAFT_2168 [Thermomyces stellatus]